MERYSDEWFMEQALRQAEEAFAAGEIPVGALLVSGERVLARTRNQTQQLHDVTAHAEMLALTAVSSHRQGKYLPDCTLYVTLEPCVMCAGALGWAQLGRLVYGASDLRKGFTTLNAAILHPKTTVTGGVQADSCKALLDGFFGKLRK